MTWIKTIPKTQADGKLREALDFQHALYPPEYEAQVPGVPDADSGGIVASHTLIPDGLKYAFATFGAAMAPDLPLTRAQHEMIATVVSTTNCTFYCGTSHREFLRRVVLDDALVNAIAEDFRNAPISDADKMMLEYAEQITRDATQISRQTHEELRSAGFDDTAILQITMIASWFNYINRMADALGVGRE